MKQFRLVSFALVIFGLLALTANDAGLSSAQSTAALTDFEDEGSDLTSELAAGLAARCIGPAMTSGRISAIAFDPRDSKVWYACGAAGGCWKTTDGGTSFKCMTDNIGSFCMGSVALDPKNPDIVWLGTGEQQSQRSVDYGDGVYKSMDGGKTWKNMGLVTSEHIARIRIDPRNTDVVYVASIGPLWNSGGERGIYKTTDGGKTWNASLTISENTGCVDLVIDSKNPDNLYAAAFQRRRHTGACLAGGPECGIYKTADGGATWTKMTKGLPTSNMGRIALEISPQNPNTVYAQIAATSGSGFYRTDDQGATWAMTSSGGAGANMYYGDIYADPHKVGRVIITNTNLQQTLDGGKTISGLGVGKGVHVDHHAVAFDLKDANHVLLGNDGGLYESKDGMKSFRHFPAIAISQFYKMCTDNATPFYNVYGGAQDNGSQRVASRTLNKVGIRAADAKKVGGGDGFQPRVDPEDPKIVYTTSQNGAMSRSDGGKGGKGGGGGGKSIRPGAGKGGGKGGGGGGGGAFNWDTPYIISPHSRTRLYAGSAIVYRSDNRGDSWTAISPNLTRSMKAMEIPLMGKVWGKDTPARNASTTPISVLNALEESPVQEGLLYAGSNDGILSVSEDTGKNWRKIDSFPGIPKLATISHICPSPHDKDTVYVSFIYYEYGDFKPYILKSTDRAKTWTSISSNLSARDFVWTIIEDPVKKGLLFAGTEFGLYFSVDDGKKWVQFKNGVPVISFRDIEIQKREADLACGTFGRGFFIVDDITPLRQFTPQTIGMEGTLFAPRKTYVYEEKTTVQKSKDNSEMPNPPFGALISYYLGKDASAAKIVVTVMDSTGKKLREIDGTTKAGFNRVAWDLRPTGGETTLVKPGKYKVALAKVVSGTATPLGTTQEFEVVPLPGSNLGEDEAFVDEKRFVPAY